MHKATVGSRQYRSRYDLQNDFKNIKNAFADTTHDVSGRMAEILARSAQDVKDKSLDAKDYAGDYISQRPFKSLGIAVLIGMTIGSLIGFLWKK